MSNIDDKKLYSAFKAMDPRFDGRFFVGVSSTGIYCRPVCTARLPKPENCTYFTTAAEAEQAGYRPCLICRPELAPGNAPVDAISSLAQKAARFLEEEYNTEDNLEGIAAKLGCTDRHMRRAFKKEFNVTPVQYLQTTRLLLAKNLLTDSDLTVTEVAMAAGFGSLRRFNDLFKKRYNLAPTALRKRTKSQRIQNNDITLQLGYHPPYLWEEMLEFLNMRAIPGVEKIKDNEYMRTVYILSNQQVYTGWIRIGNNPKKNTLIVTFDASLLPVLPRVLTKVRNLFDLRCDLHTIFETLTSMDKIKSGICKPGTRLPGCFDPFEMSVRAVLGQQISVKAASTLAARLTEAYGTPLETGIEGLTHIFPTSKKIVSLKGTIDDNLGPLGITKSRSRTILELANVINREEIDFEFYENPETEIDKLLQIQGIGNWTAQYIAMRGMGWPDAFPHTDLGVKKALAPLTEKEILETAEQWRPWRSYATINLWNSL